jgi:hypothetical protein
VASREFTNFSWQNGMRTPHGPLLSHIKLTNNGNELFKGLAFC